MTDPDYLTDEDAAAMFRAAARIPPEFPVVDRDLLAVRRAWAARPATARAVDVAASERIATRKPGSEDRLLGIACARGLHLTGDSNG